MARITTHQHVQAPLEQVFEYFVDFERYPEFMKGIRWARRDESHEGAVRFRYGLVGIERECSVVAEVDRERHSVSWYGVEGPRHTGTAVWREVHANRCAVALDVQVHPSDLVGVTGSVLGLLRTRIEHDLHRFASYVERETGNRPPEGADYRAPSERLFEKVFPIDDTQRHS
ncbi:polyketide cyclase/dehydrase/lipid transport protein [Prauserella shujinwangii]|uniref:Polyketide cyclase/dehydrase/lipid transport protein n=1 Tax=Prauserella shujinwangii TaxID=1453103 RepID=A0A2T0M1L7_9PSEU|nr:SRPBCC family protein [Prauserella shujinwangii]PRX50450.1 polyketide cyclase/dehydrase/lipid transport protein [Prauserella shujinwangii]